MKSELPLLIILSGPSGVGKDAVLTRMKKLEAPLFFAVTTTTRTKRNSEKDGVDYSFVSKTQFRKMIKENDFLEWAEVYGNFYGVPKGPTINALAQGHNVIIKVDVQGADTIRTIAPEIAYICKSVFIFLAPPSLDELTKRLNNRMSESENALELRLKTAKKEVGEQSKFDFVVTNYSGHLSNTVREIEVIVSRARSNRPPN